jgi:predicted Fe-Mo cluster-binding NifX family protein
VRLAVPVHDGRVAPALDWAGRAVLVDLPVQAASARLEVDLTAAPPEGRAALLAAHDVSVLVCGGVSAQLAALLESRGIAVFPGVAGELDAVVAAFAAGELEDPEWAMPGWCARRRECGARRRWRGGRGRGGRGGPPPAR